MVLTFDNINTISPSKDVEEDSIPLHQPSQESNIFTETTGIVALVDYLADLVKVPAQDRNRFLLGACYGVVPNFNLKSPPYSNQTNRMLPTNDMLK